MAESIRVGRRCLQDHETISNGKEIRACFTKNRSAVSIPSNIAEGAGRNSNGEFKHFLGISTGSAFELETQLLLAGRLGYIENEKLETTIKKISDIQNMTFGLQKKLKSQSDN